MKLSENHLQKDKRKIFPSIQTSLLSQTDIINPEYKPSLRSDAMNTLEELKSKLEQANTENQLANKRALRLKANLYAGTASLVLAAIGLLAVPKFVVFWVFLLLLGVLSTFTAIRRRRAHQKYTLQLQQHYNLLSSELQNLEAANPPADE